VDVVSMPNAMAQTSRGGQEGILPCPSMPFPSHPHPLLFPLNVMHLAGQMYLQCQLEDFFGFECKKKKVH